MNKTNGTYDWNPDTIRWYREASEYTGYSAYLAEVLRPYLNSGDSLCDMGCGLGLVDLELAGYVDRITCVDISAQAIHSLRSEAATRGIKNINAVCADGLTLAEDWDIVLCLFHGHHEEMFLPYLQKASKRLLYVTRTADKRRNGIDADSCRRWLDRHRIRYTEEKHELEFGQPFRDLTDAVSFVRTYYPRLPETAINSFPEKHCIRKGRNEYSLYLPKKRSFTLFVVNRD